MALPDYTIEHQKAHRDTRAQWRAETIVTVGERHKIRILTMQRQDGVCRSTARCTRLENAFEGERDFFRELRSADPPKVTRNSINALHFAAVFDLRALVLEIARFYELDKGKQ